MPFFFFIWTDRAVQKIGDRDISIDDVEEIISQPDSREISRSTGHPVAIGQTAAGRTLVCVYQHIDGDTVQPITAFEIE